MNGFLKGKGNYCVLKLIKFWAKLLKKWTHFNKNLLPTDKMEADVGEVIENGLMKNLRKLKDSSNKNTKIASTKIFEWSSFIIKILNFIKNRTIKLIFYSNANLIHLNLFCLVFCCFLVLCWNWCLELCRAFFHY